MRFTELTTRSLLPLSAATLLLLSACGGDKTKATDSASVTPPAAAVATDSGTRPALRDSVASIEVVPPAASTAEAPLVAGRAPAPAAKPTTTRPKPTASRPTTPRSNGNAPSNTPATSPAPSATPAQLSGTVASGTSIRVISGEKVCSNSLAVGDRITTTTNSVVSATNGVSIPSGARVSLVVTKSKTSSRQGDDAELAFDVRSVTFGGDTFTMVGDVATEAVVTERKGGDGKKVAIGAAAGAIIGNIIGGGSRAQRTVVGAAAGGAAGAVAAAVTGDRFACLPEGSALTVHLGSALTVHN
jgi:hypothetical protein